MPKLVVQGALLRCSQGIAPTTLSVTHGFAFAGSGALAATVADHAPMANVSAFGMCRSTANPQVASATAAALGVLTPQPCVPVIGAPWSPGATLVGLDGVRALSNDSSCQCQWAGTITIEDPGSDVNVE